MIEFLKSIPVTIQIAVGGIILGVGGLVAADSRYVLASLYDKSFVLQSAAAVRELRKELRIAEDQEDIDLIREEIEQILDDMCYEAPDHAYCKDRE